MLQGKRTLWATSLSFVGLLAMTGCSEEKDWGGQASEPLRFEFTTTAFQESDSLPQKPGTAVAGRVVTDPDTGEGTFENGDRVSLFSGTTANYDQLKHFMLTYQDGNWNPPIPREQLGEGFLTLTAYYPGNPEYQLVNKTACKHEVPLDQSTSRSMEKADLLWASTELTATTQTVKMNFVHTMFRVHVDLTEFDSPVTAVRIRGKRRGTVDI